jgi:4-diphosphocytidyl-2-C-methyl-D-erythritol kinase
MQVTVIAPAKINLTLDVVGRRADGYHLLESVMQSVDYCDTLMAVRADTVTLRTVGGEVCPVEKNTAYRAATAFFAHTGIAGGAAMVLHKHIPQQAGMGGGSADAAAALYALDTLYDTRLSVEELCAIGVTVGADVPFCIAGGAAYVTGIGEQIDPLPPMPTCSIVIAQPDDGVSTAEAYAAIDSRPMERYAGHPAMLAAMRAGDLAGICRAVYNVFEPATAIEGVRVLRERMAAYAPLAVQMTGSGSAVFAVFDDEAAAQRCADALHIDYAYVRVCRPCDGCQVIAE